MAFVPKKIKKVEMIKDYREIIEFDATVIKVININEGNYSIFVKYQDQEIRAEGNSYLFKNVIEENTKFHFYGYIEDNKMEVLKLSLIPHKPTLDKFLTSFFMINSLYLKNFDTLLFFSDLDKFKENLEKCISKQQEYKVFILLINRYFFLNELIDFFLTYEIDEKTSSNIFNYYESKYNEFDNSKLESFKKSFLKSPYFLTDLSFIKFNLIDDIGLNYLKISKNDETRLRYLIKTELFDYITKNGNTYIFYNDFLKRFKNSFNDLEKMVEIGKNNKDIVHFMLNNEECITVNSLYNSEIKIRKNLLNIAENGLPIGKIYNKSINELLNNEKKFLTKKQINTIKELLNNKISILTGGPGTGKTTIIKYLTYILDNLGVKYCLLSPTGKAASRIKEVTGKEAKTIHRAFGINPLGIVENVKNKLNETFYIIDESSMLSNNIFEVFISNIPARSQIILVGDRDQLPPVEYGDIFKELIKSNKFNVSVLTEIHRTKGNSSIPIIAQKINNSESIQINDEYINNDFSFIHANSENDILEKMIIAIDQLLSNKKYDSMDIQVLSPQNKGELGVKNLNYILKEVFNPSLSKKISLKNFSVGDKVIQTTNNYDKNIYNGEIGIVKSNDLVNEIITIDFCNNKKISINNKTKDIELAYAITIHKSQGSESRVIIIPISEQHEFMLNKNLIYTGVTRSSEKVILIGDLKLFNKSIKKVNQNKKLTLVSYLLNR